MGAGTFFSKVASDDPLAQGLDLPGAHKYQQQSVNAENQNPNAVTGPYAGMTPSLAGANAGYAPGGPGANANYQAFGAANSIPSYGAQTPVQNPYVAAAANANANALKGTAGQNSGSFFGVRSNGY